MTLQDALYKFHGAQKGEELTSHFKELAPYFLYKGYYQIGNDYQIWKNRGMLLQHLVRTK